MFILQETASFVLPDALQYEYKKNTPGAGVSNDSQ